LDILLTLLQHFLFPRSEEAGYVLEGGITLDGILSRDAERG
jgi:hypothetical protein